MNVIWTEDYLAGQLRKKKIIDNEQYKDYNIKDYLVECLDNEIIYNYDLLDRNLFRYCFCLHKRTVLNVDQNWLYETYEIFGKDLEEFSESFKSREVRIKVMYYIHENVKAIWDNIIADSIQDHCARIINKNIREVENEDYQDMPRPDFKKLIFDPNFFKEKTPSRRWCEEHNLDIVSAIPAIESPEQEKVEDEVIVEQPQTMELQDVTAEPEDTTKMPTREKFRYIISDAPDQINEIEKALAIYVKANRPSDLCNYILSNKGKKFVDIQYKASGILEEIERIWPNENKITDVGLRQALKRAQ